jgi:predicted RNase H-like HicB family nuclease
MGNTKEKQPDSTYYALFIPTQGKYFIIFPDFCHTLPRVSTLEECPHAARELLNNILLRHLIDREPLPAPSPRHTAEQNTLDYIPRNHFLPGWPANTASASCSA